MAAGYRYINTENILVGILQKWPAKAGGRSHKGPSVAGTTVYVSYPGRHWFFMCRDVFVTGHESDPADTRL